MNAALEHAVRAELERSGDTGPIAAELAWLEQWIELREGAADGLAITPTLCAAVLQERRRQLCAMSGETTIEVFGLTCTREEPGPVNTGSTFWVHDTGCLSVDVSRYDAGDGHGPPDDERCHVLVVIGDTDCDEPIVHAKVNGYGATIEMAEDAAFTALVEIEHALGVLLHGHAENE